MSEQIVSQRGFMRALLRKHGPVPAAICRAYAEAEMQGLVWRQGTKAKYTAAQYANLLWNDGLRKGWLEV